MKEWKDISSYSRSDTDRTPKVWELRTKSLSLSVHRHIHYAPDQWLLTCHDLGIEKKELKSKDIEEAKVEAFGLVVGYLNKLLVELTDL